MENQKRGSFTGSIGFVFAAAGSAVGLGNLWRFPYLAAKDGGGLFLIVYVLLVLTFGFTLMLTEIALGRKTGSSCAKAYAMADKRFGFLGALSFIVPSIIFPYYCVIGGWITKYMGEYCIGRGINAVADGYFKTFISSQWSPIFWCAVFLFVTSLIVFFGVEKGIEKFSKALMPLLCVIIVCIAIFTLTVKDPQSGRTALDGLKIYLIPNFEGITIGKFFKILLDAMGQIFFSMSLAMGIMVTYGSYSKKESNLVKSVNQIEIFDTSVALIAGLIMVCAVYTFQGTEGLSAAGPSLLFVSMPKVFNEMGFIGNFVGAAFFILVWFAAITSSVSLLEAIVSMIMDKLGWSRKKTTTIALVFSALLAIVTCLGYNVWYFEATLKIGSFKIFSGYQILDIMDFVINWLLMPVIALITCVLFGWFCGTKYITDEVKRNGEVFKREGIYNVMIKYVAPVFLFLILISAFGVFEKL